MQKFTLLVFFLVITATDDLNQDEQNESEIREEIIPIRKDSRKKRIRTSSIDVPLKDVTVKYGDIRIVDLYSKYFFVSTYIYIYMYIYI